VNFTTFLHVVAKLRMSVVINSTPISLHGKQRDNFVGLNKICCLMLRTLEEAHTIALGYNGGFSFRIKQGVKAEG